MPDGSEGEKREDKREGGNLYFQGFLRETFFVPSVYEDTELKGMEGRVGDGCRAYRTGIGTDLFGNELPLDRVSENQMWK